MNFKPEFHPAVAIDYNEAYEWYEQQKDGLGEEFIKSLNDKFNDLIAHPDAFGQRSKIGYKEAKVNRFPYLIIYKIYPRKKIIFVNAIHHISKDSRKKYRK